MRRNWIIIGLSGFLLVIVLLALHLHHSSGKEVLSQFEDHQFLHAQNIAQKIESMLLSQSRELRTLSVLISPQEVDREQGRVRIEILSKQLEKAYVKGISLYNESGKFIYSTTSLGRENLKDGENNLLSWAKKRESRGRVLVLPLFPDGNENELNPEIDQQAQNPLRFLLATPVYGQVAGVKPFPTDRFAGIIAFSIDLREFLVDQMGFVDPEMNLHQVWIMDQAGKLLFQSEHGEMVQRNIFAKDQSCSQCHTSFDYAEEILKKRQGTLEYSLKNPPKKFAAFAPMDFENESWVVVVNSSLDELMAFERRDMRGHLLLLGVVALSMGIGALLISRNYRAIVRAEEEAKHWREKQSLEEKIRQSEVLYRTIVETAHDIIWILNDQGKFTFINKRGETIFGYKPSEWKGRSITALIPPGDLPGAREAFLKTLQGGSRSYELKISARDGEILILSVNTAPLYKNGEVSGTVSFGRDITEQKKAEMALQESENQLRSLSSQLLTAQETERRRISRELHDELGQALTAMKLRLRFIEKGLEKDQITVRQDCEDLLGYIDQAIENTRRLSLDLSPSILEDLGLTAALQWLTNNFIKNNHITVKMDMIEIDHLFSQDAQTMIYRIIQETLTNIGKHARANNVSIAVRNHDGRVSFFVEDDGKGFNVKEAMMNHATEKGLGLATMNERARILGGSFNLWSQEGKGTRVSLTIPLKNGETLS
jgi:PAS domain S-box-containing protein